MSRWQSPLRISLISFLVMLAIVVAIGLLGAGHIVGYLQKQLIRHGFDHNRDALVRLSDPLHTALAQGHDPERVLQQFQVFAETAGVFGVRLFLFDRASRRVLADNRPPHRLPYALKDLFVAPLHGADGTPVADPVRWEGNAWLRAPDDGLKLVSLSALDLRDREWTLGVASDPGELLALMGQLHFHLDMVLLLTYGLIGILGFLGLRWIGRQYEQSLEDQVAARTQELEQVHRELLDQARLATIGRTAAVLAHEMRNPLASIKLALSGIARACELDPRQRQRLDLVQGEVDRLEALLSDTLDYVKPVKPGVDPVALDDLIDEVLALEAPLLEQARIRVHRRRCPRCPPLRLDRAKMRQSLLNLVRNAREATGPEGEVRIELSTQEGESRVHLVVANRGEPLSAQVQARAFEFFFTTKPRGTGLGLGLVKRVVEAHRGQVALEGRQEWIRVTICLPANR